MREYTIEEQLAAKDSEIARLSQELSRKPPAKLSMLKRQHDQVETKVVTLWLVNRGNSLPLKEEELAKAYSRMISEQLEDDFKLVGDLGNSVSGNTRRYIFERFHRCSVKQFSMNDLVWSLKRLLEVEKPWTLTDRIQLKHLPDGFTDWVGEVLNVIDSRCPSGHLINADEAALILMRVACHFAPDEELARRWRTSVRRSTTTGDGQYQCHIDDGVVDHMDRHMERLLGDPMDNYEGVAEEYRDDALGRS